MKAVSLIKELVSTDTARVAEYRMEPRSTGSRHIHNQVFEEMYCLSGMLRMNLADRETVDLAVGDSVMIPAGTLHCVSNRSDGESRFLVVQGGGSFDLVSEA